MEKFHRAFQFRQENRPLNPYLQCLSHGGYYEDEYPVNDYSKVPLKFKDDAVNSKRTKSCLDPEDNCNNNNNGNKELSHQQQVEQFLKEYPQPKQIEQALVLKWRERLREKNKKKKMKRMREDVRGDEDEVVGESGEEDESGKEDEGSRTKG